MPFTTLFRRAATFAPKLSSTPASSAARTFSSTSRAQGARMNIIGRLGNDPEVTSTSTGRDLIKYVIGSSHGPANNRQTSWFRLVSFDEGARKDYLSGIPKGSLVSVEADAKLNVYTDEQTGKNHGKLDLVQTRIEVLSRARQNEGGYEGGQQGGDAQAASG